MSATPTYVPQPPGADLCAAGVFGPRFQLLPESSVVPVDLWAICRVDGSLARLVGRSGALLLCDLLAALEHAGAVSHPSVAPAA